MHIDFEQDDWKLIRSKLTASGLDEADVGFLGDTFAHWEAGDLQLLLSTSGSTGSPKKQVLQDNLLRWSVDASAKALGIEIKQQVFCCLPVNKAGGAMQVCRSYLLQWEITVVPPTADPLSEMDREHHYTLTSFTPFQVTNILENAHSTEALKRFGIVLIGGGLLPHDLRSKLALLGGGTRFIQTYGMTETAGHVALSALEDDGLFTPLQGVGIDASDSGNVMIRIPSIGFDLETNDRIEQVGNRFKIIGRSDFVINTGGLKIQPEMLEERIKHDAAGRKMPSFFFYGMPDETHGQHVALFIEGDNRLTELEELVRSKLDGPERPRAVYYVTEFYHSSGKLDRRKTVRSILQND